MTLKFKKLYEVNFMYDRKDQKVYVAADTYAQAEMAIIQQYGSLNINSINKINSVLA